MEHGEFRFNTSRFEYLGTIPIGRELYATDLQATQLVGLCNTLRKERTMKPKRNWQVLLSKTCHLTNCPLVYMSVRI